MIGRFTSGVLGPGHVVVVAVMAAVAVGVAAWLVVRDQAEPVAMPAVEAVDTPLASMTPTGVGEGEGATATVNVHVPRASSSSSREIVVHSTR